MIKGTLYFREIDTIPEDVLSALRKQGAIFDSWEMLIFTSPDVLDSMEYVRDGIKVRKVEIAEKHRKALEDICAFTMWQLVEIKEKKWAVGCCLS